MAETRRLVGSALLLVLLSAAESGSVPAPRRDADAAAQQGAAATPATTGDSLPPDTTPPAIPDTVAAQATDTGAARGGPGSATGESGDGESGSAPESHGAGIIIPTPLGPLTLSNVSAPVVYVVLAALALWGLYYARTARKAGGTAAAPPWSLRRLMGPAAGFAAGFTVALLVVGAFAQMREEPPAVEQAPGEQRPVIADATPTPPPGTPVGIAPPAGTPPDSSPRSDPPFAVTDSAPGPPGEEEPPAGPPRAGSGERSTFGSVFVGMALVLLGAGLAYAIERARKGIAPPAPVPSQTGTDAPPSGSPPRGRPDPRYRVAVGRLFGRNQAGVASLATPSAPPSGAGAPGPQDRGAERVPLAVPPVSPYAHAVRRYADRLAVEVLVEGEAASLLGDLALYVRDRFDGFAGDRVVVGVLAHDLTSELSTTEWSSTTAGARRPLEDLVLALRRHQHFLAAVSGEAERSEGDENSPPQGGAGLEGAGRVRAAPST